MKYSGPKRNFFFSYTTEITEICENIRYYYGEIDGKIGNKQSKKSPHFYFEVKLTGKIGNKQKIRRKKGPHF